MPDAPAPKILFFDLGNVVVQWSAERLVRNLAQYCPLSVAEVADRLWNSTLDPAYVEGRLTTEQFRDGMAEVLDADWTDRQFADAWHTVFDRMPEMEALVEECAAVIPTYALSNTNALHFDWLQANVPVLQVFRGITASHEAGAQKPDPRIYAHAIELAGCDPADGLFMDDLQPNVDGARAFGLQAIKFHSAAALRGELINRGVELAE